jgi:hypothetical protein
LYFLLIYDSFVVDEAYGRESCVVMVCDEGCPVHFSVREDSRELYLSLVRVNKE